MRVWALPPQSATVQAARLPHAAEPPGSAEQPLYHSLVLPEPETGDPDPPKPCAPGGRPASAYARLRMHLAAWCTTLSSVGPSQAIQTCRGCWKLTPSKRAWPRCCWRFCNAIRCDKRSTGQMRRYAQATWVLLGEPARVRLCFLDNEGRISLQEM